MNLNNNTKIILGITVAVGLGIALAMLLAPEKSNNFRKKFSASLDDLGQKVSELLGEEKQHLLTDNGMPVSTTGKGHKEEGGTWKRKTTF